ncbi:MAG: enoyl-CoA hydratase/isomerase family protein [Promethearchaeota archaeon]
MQFETLEFELKENGIGILSLNRPEKLNAMSFQMFEDLHAIYDHLMTNLDCRVVILAAKGRAFCAGLDLSEINIMRMKRIPEEYKKFKYMQVSDQVKKTYYFQWMLSRVIIKMRKINQPVIAVVNGAAAGGGFGLTLASDIRIAGKNARFSNAFINVASYFLPRLIGMSRATEILYTGRFIDAEEALRIGLVLKLIEGDEIKLFEAAIEIAENLLTKSPLGLRMTKEAINLSQDSPSLETIIQLENRAQTLCSSSSDMMTAVMAFFKKEPPKYSLR